MVKGIYNHVVCPSGKVSFENFVPQKHQIETRDFFLSKNSFKGLLLYHKLGSGKTCTALMIADAMLKMWKEDRNDGITRSQRRGVNKVYILSPGSLRQGWINEYCNVCGSDIYHLVNSITFVTYNYSTGLKFSENDLKYSLVIIDEVHNLINGVKNGSKNPTLIYDHILESNCRILALSGTVLYNDLSEFALLGNLLKPSKKGEFEYFPEIRRMAGIDKFLFESLFNFDKDGNITEKDPIEMKRRMEGIISYYPGNQNLMPEIIEKIPLDCAMSKEQQTNYWHQVEIEEKLSHPPSEELRYKNPLTFRLLENLRIMALKKIISRVASNFYYGTANLLDTLQDYERSVIINKLLFEKKIELKDVEFIDFDIPIDKLDISLREINELIRVEVENEKSRKLREREEKFKRAIEGKNMEDMEVSETKLQNYFSGKGEGLRGFRKALDEGLEILDEEEILFEKVKRDIRAPRGWITSTSFANGELAIHSSKFVTLLINIVVHLDQKHCIYSFFKERAGGILLKTLLTNCGISADIFSGDLNDGERHNLLKKFNSSDNLRGEKLRVLIITSAGIEGISLKTVRHLHILEPDTKPSKITQVIGRVARFMSHVELPIDERNVQVWRYHSVCSKGPVYITERVKNAFGEMISHTREIVNVKTIDKLLYQEEKKIINRTNTFLKILQNNSVITYENGKTVEELKESGELQGLEELVLREDRENDIYSKLTVEINREYEEPDIKVVIGSPESEYEITDIVPISFRLNEDAEEIDLKELLMGYKE